MLCYIEHNLYLYNCPELPPCSFLQHPRSAPQNRCYSFGLAIQLSGDICLPAPEQPALFSLGGCWLCHLNSFEIL